MRYLPCLILLCLFRLSVFAQLPQGHPFTFKGTITDADNVTLYFTYEVNGERVKDSCKVQQGQFSFTGKIYEPSWAFLKASGKVLDVQDANIVDFFIDPTVMTATIQYNHFKEIKITGSTSQQEFAMLKKQNDAIDRSSGSLSDKIKIIYQDFIRDHPDSYVSAYELNSFKTRWGLDSVKALYARLTPAIQNSFYARGVKKTIGEIDDNSAGMKAKAFKRTDINGKPLQLSDFAGKYVLLDFWGSWCVPCRESTPHMIEVFKKYHDQGLHIVAIANEEDKTGKAWKAAIKKDGTAIWHNILSDEKGNAANSSGDIAHNYGIKAYPTKILIDKNGTIIGRYAGTEQEPELDQKLREIFK